MARDVEGEGDAVVACLAQGLEIAPVQPAFGRHPDRGDVVDVFRRLLAQAAERVVVQEAGSETLPIGAIWRACSGHGGLTASASLASQGPRGQSSPTRWLGPRVAALMPRDTPPSPWWGY